MNIELIGMMSQAVRAGGLTSASGCSMRLNVANVKSTVRENMLKRFLTVALAALPAGVHLHRVVVVVSDLSVEA